MSTQDQEPGALDRRRLFRGAGLGVAGVAFSAAAPAVANAELARPPAAQFAGAERSDTREHEGSVIAHLHDARSGMVELIIDGEEKTVHSPELARALARAAAHR